jgi:hypothetical protein
MPDVIALPSVGQRENCETHFIHDEAPPHSVLTAPAWLDSHFTGRWIGRGEPSKWIPRSTGLNPCNLFCAVETVRSTDQNQNTQRTGPSSKYFYRCFF